MTRPKSNRRPIPPPPTKPRRSALTPVSRETEARLDRYVDLLVEWQAKTNLVAPSTLPNLWTRHIADSLQLLDLAPSAKIWVDLGSGGGFPGRGAGLRAGGDAGRQCPSGRAQRQEGGLPARGRPRHCCGWRPCIWRASGIVWIELAGRVDCVTARALAPLHQLVGFAEPFVKEGAKALFLKGQDVEAELTEATKYWNIEPRLHSSRTGGHGWIVELDRIERRNPSAITHGDRA